MANTETIQQRAADTILQRRRAVQIGGETIEVAPPTVGTLIIMSEYLSQMPDMANDKERYLFEVIAKAKDCKPLAYAVSALIVGAKHWDDEIPNPRLKRRFPWQKKAFIKRRDYIADLILNELSPAELSECTGKLLNSMEIADFFACTIFLQGAAVGKPTRKMTDTGATPSGPSSRASSKASRAQ